MNKYIKLKTKHEKIVNKFPQFFAFSDEQFKEGLKKLKTTKTEIRSIGSGGFIRKSDGKDYLIMVEQINKESKEALKDDDYLYQGFLYELGNHEYIITYDYEDTLSCFGLEYSNLTERQSKILEKATKDYEDAMNELE